MFGLFFLILCQERPAKSINAICANDNIALNDFARREFNPFVAWVDIGYFGVEPHSRAAAYRGIKEQFPQVRVL